MIKKIINFLKEYKKDIIISLTPAFILFLLMVIKLDYVVYSPGGLEELTNRIEVENAYEMQGSYNLTYVVQRSGSLFNILCSLIMPDWDMEKIENIVIDGEDLEEQLKRDKIRLKETSYDAIIAAFKEANINYEVTKKELVVTFIFEEAKTKLEIGDTILKVNNQEITSYEEFSSILSNIKLNEKMNILVLRDEKEINCEAIKTIIENQELIGITLSELKTIKTTPKVNYIFKENESGGSRGLLCALDIYDKITKGDLTKGRTIAGTGSIDENGVVGEIAGVKYKIKGAVKKDADIFIVPSANYEEAIKIKEEKGYDIQIIKADTLSNVIEELSK